MNRIKHILYIVLLLIMVFSLSACTDLFYKVGQPNTLEESFYENAWANEWSNIKKDFEDVYQKIELYSADNKLVLTLTDNEEIFYFTKNLEYDKWDYSVNQIPSEALKMCTFITYRKHNNQMIEVGKDTVYYDQDGYYMLSETLTQIALQVKISKQVALYLMDLLELDVSNEMGKEWSKFSE